MRNITETEGRLQFLVYLGYPGGLYCIAANTIFLVACWKARLTTKPAQHRSLYLQLFCLAIGGCLLGVGRLLETAEKTTSLGACVRPYAIALLNFGALISGTFNIEISIDRFLAGQWPEWYWMKSGTVGFRRVALLGFIPSMLGFIILLVENGINNFAPVTSRCDYLAYTPIHVYFRAFVEPLLAVGTVIIFSVNIYLMPRRNIPLANLVQKAKAKRDAEIARNLFVAILQNAIGLVLPLLFAFVVFFIGKYHAPVWAEMVEVALILMTVNSGNMILIYTWKSKDVRRAVMHHVFSCCKSHGVGGAVTPALFVPYLIV